MKSKKLKKEKVCKQTFIWRYENKLASETTKENGQLNIDWEKMNKIQYSGFETKLNSNGIVKTKVNKIEYKLQEWSETNPRSI